MIIVIIILLFLFTGCSNSEITKDQFIKQAEFDGYVIKENKDAYIGYNYIKNVYYAINREGMYFIEFLELENNDYARRFFEINKEEILKSKESNNYDRSMNSANYSLYHLETATEYKLVIRSKNNIIYIVAPIEYMREIEELLSELNIKY